MSYCIIIFGVVYDNLNLPEKALEYYQKGLDLANEYGMNDIEAKLLNNIAVIYIMRMKKYNQAIQLLERSFTIRKAMNDIQGEVYVLENLGIAYKGLGKFSIAESYFKNAIQMAEAGGYTEPLVTLHDQMRLLYDTLAQLSSSYKQKAEYYALAYQHTRTSHYYESQLFSEEKAKEIGRLEQKHEYEMAELRRQQEEAERARKEAERLRRRNLLEYSVITFVILLSFGALLLLRWIQISPFLIELAVFFAFLLFFEFILILLDPYLTQLSQGEPIWQFSFNVVLAILIAPLHEFFEGKAKKWFRVET